MMKKLLLFFALIGVVLFSLAAYNHNMVDQPSTPTQPWQPARLRIPLLHIDAPVISVGQTPTGEMDAPTSQAINSPYWTSVFWYSPGPAPGQPGNAVIAGHVDRAGGDPAIFWSLGSLSPGDSVSVQTVQGKVIHFTVTRVVSYPASAPGQDAVNAVFGPTNEHHLNLITCSGAWTGNGYDQRLVAFTTQVG